MKYNMSKGFVLVSSLLFASILLLIILPYVSRVVTEYRLTTKIYNSTAALDIAEAGIERAIWEIRYNASGFSGWTHTVDSNGNDVYTISVNGFSTYSGQAIGDYTVDAAVAPDGMSSVVISAGYVPNRNSPDAYRKIKVEYSRHNFGKAVVGLSGIIMSGQASTDSYDSSLGSYDSQPHTAEGDIVTNGPISLSGNAYVNGDAHPGPDYPFSGTPPVSGSYGTLQAPFTVDPIPPSVVSAAQATNDNSNILLNGEPYTGGTAISLTSDDVLTLPGGTYYFTSILVTSDAEIDVTGPSTIYVDGGNVNLAGKGIINAGQPRDLLLYSTGSSISLSGQSACVGAIYAPTSSVTLTGQENFYGSIICGSNMDSGQAKIHFDLDLLGVEPVFSSSRVDSWQEIKD